MRFSRHVPGRGSAFKPFAPTVEPAAPGTGALQFYLVVLEAGFSPLCSVLFSMEIRQFGRKRRNDWQHRERMQDAEKGDGKSCITPIFDTRIRNPSGPVCTRTAVHIQGDSGTTRRPLSALSRSRPCTGRKLHRLSMGGNLVTAPPRKKTK